MANYKVISVRRVTNEEYDGYRLILENGKGVKLSTKDENGNSIEAPVNLTAKYVNNTLKQEQLDLDMFSSRDVLRILKSATIDAVIEHKKKGDTFVADEFTTLVKQGKDWVKPKVGQSYEVQENGVRIDYSREVIFHFDDDLIDNLELKAIRRQAAATKVEA